MVRLSLAALRACPFRFSLLKIRPCDSRASSVRSAPPPFPCHSLPRAPRPRRLCHAIPSKCTLAVVALSYLLYQGFTQEQCDEQYLDLRNAHKRGPRYQRNRMAIDRDGLEEGKERGKERASEVPIFSALTVRRANTTTTAIKTTICLIASEPIGSASAAVAPCSTSLTHSPVRSLARPLADRQTASLAHLCKVYLLEALPEGRPMPISGRRRGRGRRTHG